MRKQLRVLGVILLIAGHCFAGQSAAKPSLVVFISVDQMRSDYLSRFGSEFTGGLKRFAAEGCVFTHADLNYAASLTGPGHASLSTGSYPRTTCIISNDWVDRSTRNEVYCVEDPQANPVGGEGGRMSPRNLFVTGLGDWIKASSPSSKAVSVGGKDRSSILMGGKHPDEVFWYSNKNGHMVTSDYYVTGLPQWVTRFNQQDWVAKNLPPAWSKLKPERTYSKDEPDAFAAEAPWEGSASFPHPFLPDKKYSELQESPYWDMLVLDFARAAVSGEKLGQRGVPDLLCISLSATDYVGHSFGPNSHEMHDHLLRLDQALGAFLADIEKAVGKGHVVVALSADHGVLPLPEYVTQIEHGSARRLNQEKEIQPRISALDEQLKHEWKVDEWLIQTSESEANFLNYDAARKAGVSKATLQSEVRKGLLSIDGIKSVYFRDELEAKAQDALPYLDQFRNSYCAERAGDFEILYCEGCILDDGSVGTTHGSPYSYDSHVAMVFWGDGIHSGHVDREVHTVDIAPTLARLLGIQVPKTVDGVPLREITGKSPQTGPASRK